MKPVLVVLAAGLSTRFGRLKQIEPIGPSGETLMDYSIWDAIRAGFGRVILVIRPAIESSIRSHMERRWPRLDWQAVFQPEPLGTAHAVLCVEREVAGPFAVLNADDFYGEAALRRMAGHLARRVAADLPDWRVAGYRIGPTLSAHGGVSRALLRVDRDLSVGRVIEMRDVRRVDRAILAHVDQEWTEVAEDARVSMNLWGFTRSVFADLRGAFDTFHAERESGVVEFALSSAVDALLVAGRGRLVMIPAEDDWLGLTHAADVAAVRSRIAAYVADGRYPDGLATGPSPARS